MDILNKAKSAFQNAIFDIIAIAVIISIIILSLDIFAFKDAWESLADILIEAIPYYIATLLLALDYYEKGAFAAKATDIYINIARKYSEMANALILILSI